ncbi:MAG TPA: AsmA family protein [Dokdonella sp.]
MKRRNRILAWVLGVVAVLVLAVVVFVATFDWNRARPYINAKVSAAIGRPFEIRGDLAVHWRRAPHGWLPGPAISVADLVVGNPSWAKEREFAHVDGVDFRLSLLPLLAHRVTIRGLRVAKPTVHLEKRADGRNNWTFELADSGGSPSSWTPDLSVVGFDTGRVTLHDAADRLDVDVRIDPLGKPIPFDEILGREPGDAASKAAVRKRGGEYAFGIEASGTYNGARVSGTGKTGGVLALRGGDQPFPLQADLRIGDVRIALVGTMTDPTALDAVDLHLRLAGDSMAHLYPVLGVALPDTPPFETDGHLTATLRKNASTFTYADFNGRVGGSDLHGTVTYAQRSPRPKLDGKLRSDQLQVADLGPLIGLDTGDKSHATRATPPGGSDAPKRPANGKVLPDDPFRTERWKVMDADVELDGKRIVHGAELPISDLRTHVVLDGGKLSLEPLDFGFADGRLRSNIALDGSTTPMRGELRMNARGLKLRELFPKMKTMQDALGELNADAALSATGNSVAALLGSSNGELKMVMDHGVVSRELMELAGLNLGNYVVVKLFGDEPVKINCAATDFVAKDGLMDARLAVIDTDNALIDLDGNVNFAAESMNLDITPHTKGLRVFSLRSPLYVRGTFADPNVGVHAGGLIARGGGAVALGVVATPVAALLPLIAPSRDDDTSPCGELLQKIRSEAPQAPPPGKRKQG